MKVLRLENGFKGQPMYAPDSAVGLVTNSFIAAFKHFRADYYYYYYYYYYEGRLKSSWTHLITPSRNFVEVR
jgi:hypothetical protein